MNFQGKATLKNSPNAPRIKFLFICEFYYIISHAFLQQQKELFLSPFRHLFIFFINHFIAFSCHSDFGCIANPLYSFAVQALAIGAMHYARKCEPPRSNLHSLADKQACRLASFDYMDGGVFTN